MFRIRVPKFRMLLLV